MKLGIETFEAALDAESAAAFLFPINDKRYVGIKSSVGLSHLFLKFYRGSILFVLGLGL